MALSKPPLDVVQVSTNHSDEGTSVHVTSNALSAENPEINPKSLFQPNQISRSVQRQDNNINQNVQSFANQSTVNQGNPDISKSTAVTQVKRAEKRKPGLLNDPGKGSPNWSHQNKGYSSAGFSGNTGFGGQGSGFVGQGGQNFGYGQNYGYGGQNSGYAGPFKPEGDGVYNSRPPVSNHKKGLFSSVKNTGEQLSFAVSNDISSELFCILFN